MNPPPSCLAPPALHWARGPSAGAAGSCGGRAWRARVARARREIATNPGFGAFGVQLCTRSGVCTGFQKALFLRTGNSYESVMFKGAKNATNARSRTWRAPVCTKFGVCRDLRGVDVAFSKSNAVSNPGTFEENLCLQKQSPHFKWPPLQTDPTSSGPHFRRGNGCPSGPPPCFLSAVPLTSHASACSPTPIRPRLNRSPASTWPPSRIPAATRPQPCRGPAAISHSGRGTFATRPISSHSPRIRQPARSTGRARRRPNRGT